MSRQDGWIGVDLDGTLAVYDGWEGINHIGKPVLLMVNRVKYWLANGREVRIVTARVSDPTQAFAARRAIDAWCFRIFGRTLPVTNEKDFRMVEMWDDQTVCVERNTGVILGRNP